MSLKPYLFLFILLAIGSQFEAHAQFNKKGEFTREDSLHGSLTPERAWWDMTHCALEVSVNPEEKSILGTNTITYKVLDKAGRMQIDLQEPMQITAIKDSVGDVTYEKEGNVYFLNLNAIPPQGKSAKVIIEFSGKPKAAKNAPWDGGWTWRKDKSGNYWIATANQSMGGSAWWPVKDYPGDEPDSLSIAITVPRKLMAVANGRLRSTTKNKGKTKTYLWAVTNPINTYGVNINIGNYIGWARQYEGEKGPLDMSFYVLENNYEKAQEHFLQVDDMLEAFEHWFGPYPFYEDGYKLVEVPYLGMEHQSSVTYGNKYRNGYLGRDLSGTGWGLKFDYIIIHESGHEWFANNVTYKDMADMWVHEGFTQYSEALFVEYHYGKEAAAEYIQGLRRGIANRAPVIGPYEVFQSGSGDAYAKGANLLHTIRAVLNDDNQWRQILRGINADFYHQTVTTSQIEEYINDRVGYDLSPVFDQYLRDYRLPVLELKREGKEIKYRYSDVINTFDMPIKLFVDGNEIEIQPQPGKWQNHTLDEEGATVVVDPDYYILVKEVGAQEEN